MDDLSGNTDISSNITMNISTNNSINNSIIENNSTSDNNDDDNKTISSIGYQYPEKLLSENNSVDDKTHYTPSLNENYNMKNTQHINYEDNDLPREFHYFKFDFLTAKRNNTHVLVESKECKRLLDLKYNDLVNNINRIQTSVIFTSTVSGFMQATKTQFNFGEIVISVISITIATYISLVLSISKYYGLDELKERIQLLREKYSLLLNEIDYNMDKLGPWSFKKQWKTKDPEKKYNEWSTILDNINIKYDEIMPDDIRPSIAWSCWGLGAKKLLEMEGYFNNSEITFDDDLSEIHTELDDDFSEIDYPEEEFSELTINDASLQDINSFMDDDDYSLNEWNDEEGSNSLDDEDSIDWRD